jgi:hypothetical protein
MDQILRPYLPRPKVAADDHTLLSKVGTLRRRCMDTIERSRVRISRSGQREQQRRAIRASSELLLRQTRKIIARNRALTITPVLLDGAGASGGLGS